MAEDLMAALEASLKLAKMQTAASLLKSEGWRIVKLGPADSDPSGPEWTTWYVVDEL